MNQKKNGYIVCRKSSYDSVHEKRLKIPVNVPQQFGCMASRPPPEVLDVILHSTQVKRVGQGLVVGESLS